MNEKQNKTKRILRVKIFEYIMEYLGVLCVIILLTIFNFTIAICHRAL